MTNSFLTALRSYIFIYLIPLILLAVFASPAIALDNVPLCKGRNLLDQVRLEQKEDYAALQKLAEKKINSNAIFWRISDGDNAPSYLFGTVHSTDPRVTALAPQVQTALRSASSVAVEIAKLEQNNFADLMKKRPEIFLSLKGPKLDTLISANDYAILLDVAVKAGTPKNVVPLFKPWFASVSYFAVPACETLRMRKKLSVLDSRITQIASAHKIPVTGLETMEEQFTSFAALPAEHQITLLENSIYSHKLTNDMYATTVELYLSRQLGFIQPLSLVYSRDRVKSQAANDAFKDVLLDKRNINMHARSLPLVKKGGAFIAVGALHLIGEMGLVALFERSGYKVEKVY